MTDQEVQLFLADLAIIILLARLLGMAAKRLGQPPVLGEIIAGILLGPTLFHGKITATLFPITLREPLSALASLGVVMFMFAVGYLLDLRLIRGRERVAASVSVRSIILPLSLGVWLGARPARGSSRRAHEGRHRRERRPAASRGNRRGRCHRQQRHRSPDRPGGHPGGQ
jgi:Kef-type K+ transport system membrane component KefB